MDIQNTTQNTIPNSQPMPPTNTEAVLNPTSVPTTPVTPQQQAEKKHWFIIIILLILLIIAFAAIGMLVLQKNKQATVNTQHTQGITPSIQPLRIPSAMPQPSQQVGPINNAQDLNRALQQVKSMNPQSLNDGLDHTLTIIKPLSQ